MKQTLKTIMCTSALLAGSVLSPFSYGQTVPGIVYVGGVPIIENETWPCDPFDTEVIRGQASLSVFSKSNRSSNEFVYDDAKYTAPPWLIIESVNRIETSANGVRSASADLYQANQSFVSDEQMQESFSNAQAYTLGLDIPDVIKLDIIATLEQVRDGYSSLSQMFSSSHNTVIHEATAYSRGIFTGKRSWYEGYLDVTAVCIPPELQDGEAIEYTMINWVDEQVAQLTPQEGEWTDWLNRDSEGGSGDWEYKSGFSSGLICDDPMGIEARLVDSPSTTYTPGDSTPDTLTTFSNTGGLVCKNAEQSDGSCNNYEIRFLCEIPQIGNWTEWLDRDSEGGSGDWEHKSGFSSAQVCDSPLAIEARIDGDPSVVFIPDDLTPDNLSVFSAEGGLVCKKSDQSDYTCNDYQVRFLCE